MGQYVDFALRGPLPSFLLALVVLALGQALLVDRRADPGPGAAPRVLVALALGASLLLAQGLLTGWPELLPPPDWPPPSTEERLFLLVVAALLLALFEAAPAGAPGPLRHGLRAVFCLAVPGWLLLNLLKRLEAPAIALRVGGLGLALLALWSALDALARRRPGPALPLVMLIPVGLGAPALLFSFTATYAQFAGAIRTSANLSLIHI